MRETEIESESENVNKEESASAIQIREKSERVQKMRQLAINETVRQIREGKQKEPNAPLERIVERVQSLGIPITAFLHEYITNDFGASVSFHIAQSYYEDLSASLRPFFIEFNPNNARAPTHFHLASGLILSLAKAQSTPEPEESTSKSGKIRYKKEK